MRWTKLHWPFVVITLFGLAMYGCTSSQPSTTKETQTENSEKMDHAGHDHAELDQASDMEKMKTELAKLPEADRLAAEKQHMCPVSGEMLGTMGVPLRVAVKGQDVFLCCEGCKEKLLANPDEFLAKLPK